MGKKPKQAKPANASAKAAAAGDGARSTGAQEAAAEAEGLLYSEPARALQLLEEALAVRPTDQAAWYHRGVACSNVWEQQGEQEPQQPERVDRLRDALSSWARVCTLDTSTRSEARYLAAVARGKLLSRAAVELHEEGDARPSLWESSCPPAREADESFKEAVRLHEQWGHPALDGESWGAWAEALALEMRLGVEDMEAGSSACQSCEAHALLAKLCSNASEKFRCAATAQVEDDGGEDDGMGDDSRQDDVHWMTLHAEHLLVFVEHAVRFLEAAALPSCGPQLVPVQQWREWAVPSWQEALALAEACERLQAGSPGAVCWKATMLRGDAIAAGAALAGALGLHCPGATLHLPGCGELAAAGAGEVATPQAPCYAPSGGAPGAQVDEKAASAMAASAYEAAAASGGPEAAPAAAQSRGELLLAHARRAARHGQEASSGRAALLEAARVFEALAAQAPGSESAATALYDLACARSMLGEAGAAAEALGRCLRGLAPAERRRWAAEAQEDGDLRLALEGGGSLLREALGAARA